MKRKDSYKDLTERYFHSITEGCGNVYCPNVYCASSKKCTNVVSADMAAVMAVQLNRLGASLCDQHPVKKSRESSVKKHKSSSIAISKDILNHLDIASLSGPSEAMDDIQNINLDLMKTVKDHIDSFQTDFKYLNATDVIEMKQTKPKSQQKGSDPYTVNNELLCALYQVFSSEELLGKSFVKGEKQRIEIPKFRHSITKEKICETEIEKEVYENLDEEKYAKNENGEKILDVAGLGRAYKILSSTKEDILYKDVLCIAIGFLCAKITVVLHYYKSKSFPISQKYLNDVLHSLKVVYEMPWLDDLVFVTRIARNLVAATCTLPIAEQAKLAKFWCENSSESKLQSILHCLQETITSEMIKASNRYHKDAILLKLNTIINATQTMKIVYYASIMAGESDDDVYRDEIKMPEKIEKKTEDIRDNNLLEDILVNSHPKSRTNKLDPLAEILNINILACHAPLIPISTFYNDLLSHVFEIYIEKNSDIQVWRKYGYEAFSYMSHSFILALHTKINGFYHDHRMSMIENRYTLEGRYTDAYLNLKVRREHVVQDALVQLEMVAKKNPSVLKKKLRVQFEGEQGVDAGGLSKEFFHLIVEKLFNPDYGMFVNIDSDCGNPTYWFNSFSFETAAEYSLIGLIVGLAIYNNIILNINFPIVVYRKLLGKRCTFNDLQDWNQVMYKNLKYLLDYKEDNIEDVFMQTFRICYQDPFGKIVYHDLIDNGNQITVNHSNKKKFVHKYANFLLNESIRVQFNAFYHGFQNFLKESPLQQLFWPEDLEQLVCGSKVFDISDLKKATFYDGYQESTPVIHYFWNFVYASPLVFQKKILLFITGSDRVPVGGLGKLRLRIHRNGTDSDRLPTTQTCCNILLLPEYRSQRKLNKQLSKAINYTEGFGLL